MRPVLSVSVVIATRDRPASLRALLDSIFVGDCLPTEIIVADQSQGAFDLDEAPDGVHLVHLRVDSVGLSRNRNAGIAAATHDVLAFLDDDSLVEPSWLEELVSALDDAPTRTVVTGAVASGSTDGLIPSVTPPGKERIVTGRVTGGDPLFPNNMAVPRSAFDDVGLFDVRLGAGAPWFPAAEDNDFGFRLLEAGYAIEFVPSAVVHHVGARRGREVLALEWSYGRGQGAFYAKHVRWSDLHMLRRLTLDIGSRLRRVPAMLRGDRAALRELPYLAGLLLGALGWRLRYPRALQWLSRERP